MHSQLLKIGSDLDFREEQTPWSRIKLSIISQGFNKQVLLKCIFEVKMSVAGNLELIDLWGQIEMN